VDDASQAIEQAYEPMAAANATLKQAQARALAMLTDGENGFGKIKAKARPQRRRLKRLVSLRARSSCAASDTRSLRSFTRARASIGLRLGRRS